MKFRILDLHMCIWFGFSITINKPFWSVSIDFYKKRLWLGTPVELAYGVDTSTSTSYTVASRIDLYR
jgi:hypothetical protein